MPGRLVLGAFIAAAFGCGETPPSDVPVNSGMFVPVSVGRIANDGGASRGVAWSDFDRDGDADLVVANTAGQWNALYVNLAGDTANDGSQFIKISDPNTSTSGPVAAAGGRAEGVSWVDYDGDGDLDLHIVTRGPEADFLFNNDGARGLVRVLQGPLVREAGSSMACWADADGDGWLDVYLVAYRDNQRNALLRNRGGGVFEDIPNSPAAFGTGTGRSCAWGDPNDDGLPDLYVGLAQEPNRFFWNRGDFVFERDADAGHLVEHVGYSYGLSWVDYDGDGHHDLFVANYDVANVLYRNDGTGSLMPVTSEPIASESGGASKGHTWGDYDLDGDLDLFVANGTYAPDMRNFLYLNDGVGQFSRDFSGDFAEHADTSAGTAWADFDLDGDLDLFVANWGSSDQVNRLYRNTTSETTGRGWVIFRLRSESRNTHGWGAKVKAKAMIRGTPRWMTRWNIPTTGYGSQNSLLIHFGVDDAASVDSLVITWPSGHEDVHTDIPVREIWIAVEGGSLAADPRVSGR